MLRDIEAVFFMTLFYSRRLCVDPSDETPVSRRFPLSILVQLFALEVVLFDHLLELGQLLGSQEGANAVPRLLSLFVEARLEVLDAGLYLLPDLVVVVEGLVENPAYRVLLLGGEAQPLVHPPDDLLLRPVVG